MNSAKKNIIIDDADDADNAADMHTKNKIENIGDISDIEAATPPPPLVLSVDKIQIKQYFETLKHYLMVTVFDEVTWAENRAYLARSRSGSLKCVYCSPARLARKLLPNAPLFILEMRNDLNRIMGIGLVLNDTKIEANKYSVYSNRNYNRYCFRGSRRIDRSDMSAHELAVMCVLDAAVFNGHLHMKRCKGIQLLPMKTVLKYLDEIDFVEFVMNMFKRRQ